MKNTIHTPGPWWFLRNDNEGKTFAIGRTEFEHAMVQGEANARLIASAPELLAALEALIAPPHNGDDMAKRMIRARAAIAKARGE